MEHHSNLVPLAVAGCTYRCGAGAMPASPKPESSTLEDFKAKKLSNRTRLVSVCSDQQHPGFFASNPIERSPS